VTALLDRAIAILWVVARGGAWAGGAILFAISGLIAAEVIGRRFFNFSFQGVDEVSGYALAVVSAWAFGFALLSRTHIRIDTIYMLVPRRLQAVLDLLSLAAVTLFFGMVVWFGWLLLQRSLLLNSRAMTPLQTPLAIPQSIWLVGMAVFVLVAAVLFLRTALALFQGNLDQAAALAGSRSAAQEVEEEIAGVQTILSAEVTRP